MPPATLAVIIPVLNEIVALPLLLADLAAQQGVDCYIVVSDGGSTDGTREAAASALACYGLRGEVLTGPAGRGLQLNRGAAVVDAEWLLFVHADSRLPDSRGLGSLLEQLHNTCRDAGHQRFAGRFALHFERLDEELDYGCYLAELKSRLDFPGTVHGDQGMLLGRDFFRELGGFREDLPVMEDTLLAEAVRRRGRWLRCDAPIVTSPRRFRVEGYRNRQTLNALLMNFAAIGWDDLLREVPDLYPVQERARPLALAPLLQAIDERLRRLNWRRRWQIWYRTGGYVRANAWQLKLWHLARTAYAGGLPVMAVDLRPLTVFQRRFDRVTDHPPGRLAAALLTWLWFRTRSRAVS